MLFMLSNVATQVLSTDLHPTTLHILRVKLARRNAKLGQGTFNFVQSHVQDTLNTIDAVMQSYWNKTIQRDETTILSVDGQQAHDQLTMANSRKHLHTVWERFQRPFAYSQTQYNPPISTRIQLSNSDLPVPDAFEHGGDLLTSLALVELWVEDNLGAWLNLNISRPSACRQLHALMNAYYTAAIKVYRGHPKRSSHMFLIIFELWVGIDVITTGLHPLLLNYSPEIQVYHLEPLLLDKKAALVRLARLELHIKTRQSNKSRQLPSIFSDPSESCFPVKFYERSQQMRDLRQTIETEAQQARDEKSEEWRTKKLLFETLMAEANSMDCDLWTPRGIDRYGERYVGRPRHDRKCRKCNMKKDANSIEIAKHEWPLPKDEAQCKAVVFELQPPEELIFWRDSTWFVGHILLGVDVIGRQCQQTLLSYSPLVKHAKNMDRQITLASSAKPMIKTHYLKGGLNIDTIFLHNGLAPRLKGPGREYALVWTAEQDSDKASLRQYCQSRLPPDAPAHLVRQVNTTSHNHNQVLSMQSKCPSTMSPHEHNHFGTTRCGPSLQYMNIKAMITTPEADINSDATAVLITHAMLEVGKRDPQRLGGFLRDSQLDLLNQRFCNTLLNAVDARFSSIEANWKEATAAGVLLSLPLIVLSLCPHAELGERCLALIHRIRQAALTWIRQLAELYSNRRTISSETGNLKELSRQIVSSSLLVRRSFDLDPDHQQLEFAKSGAPADYVEASIHLHDHRDQASGKGGPKHLIDHKQESELLSDSYHAAQCEPHLLLALNGDGGNISDGIRRFWPTASFTSAWQTVNDNDTSWIKNDSTSRIVHYNLVTGNLLVSGKSLSRLPPAYTNHPLYRSIFADLDIEVFASDVEDMEYMSRVDFQGHQIYFGERGDSLLIRSRHGTDTYEAISRESFVGDLPEPVFRNSLPWMSLNNGTICFRRHDRAWSSHDDDWALSLDIEPGTTIRMTSDIGYLIDYRSGVGQSICNVFQPFEDPKHIVIFKSNGELTGVQIKLPRYHLNFSLQLNGDIRCKELSAIVDHSQSIGTLHGLKNKLVLRAAHNISAGNLRTVLIPNGDVVIFPALPHVEVRVRPRAGNNLTFSRYRVDGLLGQLVSDDLEAHLFKTYLHAVTSFPEPDTFTSRSGTEEALLGLSDHITRTSTPLSARAHELLGLLAALSPTRRFYPKGLQIMQTPTFHKIVPVLAQRDIFFGTVQSIILHNSKASFLYGSTATDLLTYRGDQTLLERSHYRTSKLFANEVADIVSHSGDLPYDSRDLLLSSAQKIAFSMANVATIGTYSFSVDPQIQALVKSWQELSGFHQKFSFLSISGLLDKPLQEQWAPLLTWCKTSPSKASLAFILSLMVYGDPKIGSQLRTLLAFSVSPQLQALPGPENDSYDLRDGHAVSRNDITAILHACEKEFPPVFADEDTPEARTLFVTETVAQRKQIMEAVESSWPGSKVELPTKRSLSHYDYDEVKTLLNGRFAVWYQNHCLLSLFEQYDQHLRGLKSSWTAPEVPAIILQAHMSRRGYIACPTRPPLLSIMRSVDVTEADFCGSNPSLLDHDLAQTITETQRKKLLGANETRVALEQLEDIIEDLEADPAEIVQNYGKAINTSLEALKKDPGNKTSLKSPSQIFLQEQAKVVRTRIEYIFHQCRKLLSPGLVSEHGLVGARLWPSLSYMTLLQLLSAKHRPQLTHSWKKIILRFAEEITALQRLERMQKYLAANDTFALSKELENRAHAEWSTEERPDWLLLEIQNQILIRPEQIDIAHKIMEPQSGVVLADMGIGKSSTILPMVVTALADGLSLVRVIVLKPLANEMLRILSRSLSGLVGRAVYFLPVCRQTTLAGEKPQKLQEIYESCAKGAGVLVSLPEHLNSFRLLCNDKLHTHPNLAQELFGIQQYLDRTARDVIDESDQVLEPGYELVYTTGESLILSKSPERWIVALEMLDLVQRNMDRALEKARFGLELEKRARDAFDHVRILNEAGSQALMASLVDAILQGGLPSVPLGHCNPDVLEALRSFIQDTDVDPEAFETISTHFEGSHQLDILYVVRGLICYQILTHALRKRWLVNYGLDRSRSDGCLAAVPYRAKSVPSQSSVFAQPEMMIILTTLSYYYTGLQNQEIRQCILLLLRLPDPSEEFSKWVMNSGLPVTYRNASSINLDDASYLDTLDQHLRLNKAAIDFFLKHKVFPREAREFEWKLSSSAYDLCASGRGRVTTGFSGTCDSQIPFSIEQKQLQKLRHSTASTLATILRFENRQYIHARSSRGQRLSTEEMLDLIVSQEKELSVIIDVGAQFLEDNKEIAAKWLGKCKKKIAAIFFSDNDEKMVLNRDGPIENFNSSIFKDEVGSCLLYLDEFHTRGTDFQLPDSFSAAVLLGPRISKDNLVQACMRMRKLAATQSVVFIAPPEVDQSIRAVNKAPSEEIGNFHVLRWAMHQSCLVLKHQHALCTTKGLQHSRRRIAAAHHVDDTGSVMDSETYLKTIRERESRTVSEMYGLTQSHGKELPFEPSQKELDDEIMANQLIEWQRIDTADAKDSGVSEEQEREVLHEVEEVREIQRPGEVVPATPKASNYLWNLIRDGTLPSGSSDEILPAFELLNKTRLAPFYSKAVWPAQIYATADFIRTIQPQGNSPQDDFLRPVQWVLHAKRINGPIIISPHEADILLASIRESKRATLFLYQARVTKSMGSFDNTNVYKIPEKDNGVTLSQEQVAILNLFAGQLYFNTFDDYKGLCTLIGLWDGERELPIRRKVANDNWVAPACRKANGWNECTFISSPVQHIKTFINMRRLGIEWSHTHMGRSLAGRILSRQDFEEEDDGAPVAAFGNLKVA